MEDSGSAKSLCQFCGSEGAAAATFCSACGQQMNLVLCAGCGAVNNKIATACHHCNGPLPVQADESRTPEIVSGARFRFGSGPPDRRMVIALGLVVAVALA